MKKKVLLCTLLAGSLLLGAAVPVMAAENAAQETAEEVEGTADNMTDIKESTPEEAPAPEAVSGRFQISSDDLEAYNKKFEVSSEHIVSITNNGGKYGSSALKYFIDGDTQTHWETGKANSKSFTNEVVFTFDEPAELGSIVYYSRVKGAANKGFPTSYSIYASASEKGNDFELVAKGSAPAASGGTQISFTTTTFKRLKFVFDEAKQNWAAGAEMVFYAPDTLPAAVDKLFADGTMSTLNPEYQDMEVLNKLLAEAEAHPNKQLLEKVQLAFDIQSGAVDYTDQVVSLEQRGDMSAHSKKVLNTGGYSSNILPTGLTANAGDVIKVYVDVDDGAPLPSIVFAQQIGKFSEWERSYTLKEGENILTVPKIFRDSWATKVISGGPIYFSNPYTPENQGSAPRIRIVGGQKYPLFRDGDNVENFIAELQAYQTKLAEHPDTTVDIVELYSDWFILNGNMSAAKTFLSGETNPQDTVTAHNNNQQELLRYAGIDDRSELHSRNNCRANIRLMQPFAFAYAAGGHVGFQQGSVNNFFKGNVFWAYSHEIGHQLDTRGGFIAEVTNNMWANHMQVDIQGGSDRITDYTSIFAQQASDDYTDLVKGGNNLAMWWQLHLLDENYWPRYESAYREKILADSDLTKNERMAVISCYALNMDVIEHFERYKFVERNDKIDEALAQLNIPEAPENIKPWYLWTKATLDRNSTFTQEYLPEIASVTRNNNSVKISINMDASAEQGLLGYEVMEDGKVIGFTTSSTFTGAFTDDGKEHEYTVRAYDLRMNQTPISAPYGKNLKDPSFEITGSTLIALYDTFDPLNIISAKSYDGQDISGSIQVVSNPVDTDTKGLYTVTYEVQDSEGNSAKTTTDVQVVSRFDYLSDLEETSFSVGYGKLTKDKAISGRTITLLRNNEPVTFEKGLGAHASSSIIYDIGESGYKYFESYAGIDQTVAGAKASNAIFRVVADGNVIYESKPMKSGTNAEYIKLDIEGVSQLELVADSNGSNSNDHTVWADAKFAVENSVPVINASDAVYKESENVDLDAIISAVTASDVEDGDLTEKVTYETDFTPGGTGIFDITYTVTDSEGNTVSLTKKIVVVNDFVYTSDVDWKSAKVGWGKIQKDKSLGGKDIKLHAEEGTTTYEKGLGVHAHSEVVYDLTDKDYYYFTSFVGVDQTAGNRNSSVVFQVYTDGVLAAETPLMKKDTPAEFLCVDISNAKQLKLVVTAGGNGNANDHADWGDAKFLTAVKTADKAELGSVIENAKSLIETDYTAETWSVLSQALQTAEDVYNNVKATQEETDAAKEALAAAIAELRTPLTVDALQKALDFAQKADSLSYVDPAMNHREARLSNLKVYMEKAASFLTNPDATQEDIDREEKAMIYFIEEIGQIYNPDGEPVNFTETATPSESENAGKTESAVSESSPQPSMAPAETAE